MMRTADLVASAAQALRSNPLRSALTALGVIIGVASVVAMVALGSGAQASIQNSISSLGSNLLIVVPGASQSGGGMRMASGDMQSLTLDDADAIREQLQDAVAVAPSQSARAQLVANGLNWNTRVEGATPEYLVARDAELSQGRFFDDAEERQARRVVVVGQTIVDELFPNVDPIGETMRINSGTYEIIGVLASKGQSGFGMDQDDIVVAPLSTVKRRISGRARRADTVSQISVKAVNEAALPRLQEDVTELLRQRHHIRPGADDDFTVQNLSQITEAAGQATAVFTFLLGGISAVSLLVGGIGIMNIMLVSVTERTREIGLRKALGARQTDILQQFGLEAVTLSIAGGAIGLVIGAGGAWAITAVANLPLIISPLNAALALGFSAFVGVVFGAYPAWRAAQLDPIEALRRE